MGEAEFTPDEVETLTRAQEQARMRVGAKAEPEPVRPVFEAPSVTSVVRIVPRAPVPAETVAERQQRLLERAWAGMPERYRGLVAGSPELPKRVRRADARSAIATLRPVDTGLVFMGPSGSGKTTLAAAALATAAREHAVGVMFVPARVLASARANTALGEGEAHVVSAAMRVPILLIDDLGIEEQAPRSAVGDVIDERYDRGRATWITTGLEEESLAQRYGVGRTRRLFQLPAVIVRCG